MSLGSGEIFVILILALLLFGPDKLPELARQAARVVRDVRRAADEVKSQFNLLGDEDDDEPRRPLASMRDKINESDEERDATKRAATSSTRSDFDDADAAKYGDEIDSEDTYFINDENGGAPDDNDWRRCEDGREKNVDARDDYANIEYSMDESDAPMTSEEEKLFGTAPTEQMAEATETPRDTLSELELRVTPTTSVARTSAPNRVRVDENEPGSN